MNISTAYGILAYNGFMGYFGPGYSTKDAIYQFMQRYPRGNGISTNDKNKLELYEACRIFWREISRTKNQK